MLSPYRRHTTHCKKTRKFNPKELNKCLCPLWVIGQDTTGLYHRETLNTFDLQTAVLAINRIDRGEVVREDSRVTVRDALTRYRSILSSQRQCDPKSINNNFGPVEKSLLEMADGAKLVNLDQITDKRLDELTASWDLATSTQALRVTALKRFFNTACAKGWIKDNPADGILKPKRVIGGKTLPFNLEDEDSRVLEAAWHWEQSRSINKRHVRRQSAWARSPRTATGLIYLLRYTGLRISDAVVYNPRELRKRVFDGKEVYCYSVVEQQKTKNPVWIPLPEQVSAAILNAPAITKEYPFWDGKTEKQAWGVAFQDQCLKFLEQEAQVPHIHAHRFRDTFAVDLLSRGVDIRSVSRLLGHSSIATTLEYYEHYLPSDQERLVAEVMKHS